MKVKNPVIINGVRQNVYRIGTSGGLTAVAKKTTPQKKYTVLEEKLVDNGLVQVLVERDYPITSASVTSYADGADYRNDPAQAIANAPTRVNLGDITEAQKFLENPQNYLRVLKDVTAILDKYNAGKGYAQVTNQKKEDVKEEKKDVE